MSSKMISATGAPAVVVPKAEGTALLFREQSDSLFEHYAWLYIFCREKLFRDDTERMSAALWPKGIPKPGTRLIELGCGPGFYSCGLAARFPKLEVVGVDSSQRQLTWARTKAQILRLRNCSFQRHNVLALSCLDQTVDSLIASRLFTILPDQERAVAEMFRILLPGGRCFIAEPRSAIRASVPLLALWLLARLTRSRNGYREPSRAAVLSADEFRGLLATQPWRHIEIWQEGRYQYALCEKG